MRTRVATSGVGLSESDSGTIEFAEHQHVAGGRLFLSSSRINLYIHDIGACLAVCPECDELGNRPPKIEKRANVGLCPFPDLVAGYIPYDAY